MVSVNNLTALTEDGFENLNTITNDGFGNLGSKMDRTLERQEETIEEIRVYRLDLKSYIDRRFMANGDLAKAGQIS